jgi:hypothetical protein
VHPAPTPPYSVELYFNLIWSDFKEIYFLLN